MKILVTGAAGFIGYHLSKLLLNKGHEIVGIDNINNYYDPVLKYQRLKDCGIVDSTPFQFEQEYFSKKWKDYRFIRINLEDKNNIHNLFVENQFDIVIHLAAQGGVRYSIDHPWAYIDSNIIGTMSVLEASRYTPVKHLIYASSSSVYGNSREAPFSTDQNVDHPISLYAATKKSNELMAYTYSYLYQIPTTGLRFFTVYGPWGRPDMAYFSFTKRILKEEGINIYNHGELWRDFTYIDDITRGILSIIDKPFPNTKLLHGAPYALYNIGNASPVKLTEFIKTLESILEKKALKNFTKMQPGDVLQTHADVEPLERDFRFKPETSLKEGLKRFVDWYREYYKV